MASITPALDRESIKRMGHSLIAFSRSRSLVKMTKQQLSDMPKEVMIACAPHEIALVWDKLPSHLQSDIDILKYQYCTEHYDSTTSVTLNKEHSFDVNDGPTPRRIFCCYCKIRDVNMVCDGDINNLPPHTSDASSPSNCCCNLQ